MTTPRKVAYNGTELTLQQLSKAVGLTYQCLCVRYRKGDRGEQLWRRLDCVGGNVANKPVTSLRGEGVTARAREEDAAKLALKLDQQRTREERVAEVRAAHAAAMSAPLIDSSLLTKSERAANRDRVKYSGQRCWRTNGAAF